jgi:glycerate kinase
VLGARARPGIDLLLELTGFPEKLPGAGLVITGEGSLDIQTLSGKAPAGVAAAARAECIPVVAVAGRCLLSADDLEAAGILAVYTLAALEPDLASSMTRAGELLERLARNVAENWLTASSTPGRPPVPTRHRTSPGAGPLSPATAETT